MWYRRFRFPLALLQLIVLSACEREPEPQAVDLSRPKTAADLRAGTRSVNLAGVSAEVALTPTTFAFDSLFEPPRDDTVWLLEVGPERLAIRYAYDTWEETWRLFPECQQGPRKYWCEFPDKDFDSVMSRTMEYVVMMQGPKDGHFFVWCEAATSAERCLSFAAKYLSREKPWRPESTVLGVPGREFRVTIADE